MSAGTSKYHLNCAYHGDLGVYADEAAADQAAAEHIHARHRDGQGNVAPAAEVEVREVRHFGADDAAKLQVATKT